MMVNALVKWHLQLLELFYWFRELKICKSYTIGFLIGLICEMTLPMKMGILCESWGYHNTCIILLHKLFSLFALINSMLPFVYSICTKISVLIEYIPQLHFVEDSIEGKKKLWKCITNEDVYTLLACLLKITVLKPCSLEIFPSMLIPFFWTKCLYLLVTRFSWTLIIFQSLPCYGRHYVMYLLLDQDDYFYIDDTGGQHLWEPGNCEDMSWDSLVDKYITGIVQLTPIPCFNCLYTENIQPAVELTSLVPVLKFFVGLLMYQIPFFICLFMAVLVALCR